jgi:hypothetical protein
MKHKAWREILSPFERPALPRPDLLADNPWPPEWIGIEHQPTPTEDSRAPSLWSYDSSRHG